MAVRAKPERVHTRDKPGRHLHAGPGPHPVGGNLKRAHRREIVLGNAHHRAGCATGRLFLLHLPADHVRGTSIASGSDSRHSGPYALHSSRTLGTGPLRHAAGDPAQWCARPSIAISLPEMPDKSAVHQRCRQLLTERGRELERQLGELSASVANETKSTAGDKFETARAMLHIEQDQARRQLGTLNAQLAVLDMIDPLKPSNRAGLGSLVLLSGVWYYLSTSIGKVSVDGHTLIALSLEAPLGALLKGHAPGDNLTLNGRTLVVEAVR